MLHISIVKASHKFLGIDNDYGVIDIIRKLDAFVLQGNRCDYFLAG
jgi:hypothetical protein